MNIVKTGGAFAFALAATLCIAGCSRLFALFGEGVAQYRLEPRYPIRPDTRRRGNAEHAS